MIINFLRWYKDLEVKLQVSEDNCILISSAVCEPTDILRKHIYQFQQNGISTFLEISNAWGNPLLIESIAKRYNVDPQNVISTNGVSNAIYLLCQTLLSKGDQVVVESPVYEPLLASPDFLGSKITCLKRRPPDYLINLEDIKNTLNSKTKLIFITNLHNPTGTLLSNDYLMELAREAKTINPNINIVVDEIYHDFVYGRQVPAATLDDCFISLNSLTKVYGLGCVHCGWIIARPEIIEKVKQLQVLIEGSNSKLLEAISSIIVKNLDEYLDCSLRLVSKNRELLCEYLEPLIENEILSGKIPEYGCIYFPKTIGVSDTQTFTKILSDKYQVYVVPGKFFGEPGHIRIGFGEKTEKLKISLEKFTEAFLALIKEQVY